MKNNNYLKVGFASLALTIIGCASRGGGNNILGSVDSGLSSVEKAWQQVISSGQNLQGTWRIPYKCLFSGSWAGVIDKKYSRQI